jgi:hypothetical protein
MLNNDVNRHPAVYARKMSIMFDTAVKDTELRIRAEHLLRDLTQTLKKEGCELIGHIKGLFAAGDAGHLMFGVTSYDEPAHFTGGLNSGITEAIMTVNIIVYGVGLEIIEAAFNKALQGQCFTES